MKSDRIIQIAFVLTIAMLASTACEKKTDEHVDEIEIEFSYSPDPALVDNVIHIKFEPVLAASHDPHSKKSEGDGHIEISMVTCEIGTAGGSTHQNMMLEKEDGHDHYEGEWTFTESGSYELHFGYMYAGDMHEKEFTLEVMPN
jgi:hypothetical protein